MHRTLSFLFVVGSSVLGGTALAQPAPSSGAASRPPLASVEARWDNVYCDLTELARTPTGELSVRYQYRNGKSVPQPLPHTNLVGYTMALDQANRVLFGVLKDATGKPVSSTMLNVTAARPIPAQGTQPHWARLEGPPDTVHTLTVLVEGCLPFDDVPIGSPPTAAPRASLATAIASQEGEVPGVLVELTEMRRDQSGFLTLAFRYRNTGASLHRFAHQPAVRHSYLLDAANRRKYEVVTDQNLTPLCSDTLALRSQTGDSLAPGASIHVWAKFLAPPDTTQRLTVSVPYAPPFDEVPISGSSGGAAHGGSAVAGQVIGLDAALRELDAQVTETEIRIDLDADILFDFDRADIKAEAEPSLHHVATVLTAHPGATVAIEGHTDAKGSEGYNQILSEQRAASVKRWLVTHATLDAVAISTRGWGETRPVAQNTRSDGSDDPEGRAKNRRVEIVVRKA